MREQVKGQLTLRGVVIGLVGCVVITISSVYTALKMGALPWPIVFAAIVSLFFLKALGSSSRNEVNVTHTIMSAGAMVAGGLAFTIPAVWMMTKTEVPLWQMLIVALAGTFLGLVATGILRRHFIEKAELEFPIGQAAAQTIVAGDSGGRTGVKLFGSMGFAGVYTLLRDGLGVLPALLTGGISVPGVAFGLYNSPMMLMVGFLVGTSALVAWLIGALVASFGITMGGTALGLWDVATASGIVSGLGMGVMIGSGIGVILKHILPSGAKLLVQGIRGRKSDGSGEGQAGAGAQAGADGQAGADALSGEPQDAPRLTVFCVLVLVSLVLMYVAGLPLLPCLVVAALALLACAMSAQSVGQTGIDPMEIFGLLVLLLVALLWDMPQMKLLFVAAIIAVACGLAGDVMNDFRAGYDLGTSATAQWIGQAIGAVVGAVVASLAMLVMVRAYGVEAFGPGQEFVSAQASVVASMISGTTNTTALLIGLALGLVIYWLGLPSMTFGLGIYLPVYLSFTAFLGCLIKLVFDWWGRRHSAGLTEGEERDLYLQNHRETGMVVASGILGGESIIGVAIALVSVCTGLF